MENIKFKQKTINAVRTIIKEGLFKNRDNEVKKQLIIKLHSQLCEIYNIPKINIIFEEGYLNSGSFNPIGLITLNKPSLVTYLHEFYHYKAFKKNLSNTEYNARKWSIYLYYKATPNLCMNAIKNNMIMFVDDKLNISKY